MTTLFRQPRSISCATKIPLLGWRENIRLLRIQSASLSALRGAGARPDESGRWYIRRSPDVQLEALEPFLPQLAKRVVTPNVVDLIPETSWGSSLANILTSSSWRSVRDRVVHEAFACEDCGDDNDLECHEIWAYDEESGVQTLTGLRSVCDHCHETYHLGLAAVEGRFDVAFDRLVKINRIEKFERDEYEEEIFANYLRRSDLEWELDLSLLAGRKLSLKGSYEAVGPQTIVGRTRLGEHEVTIRGMTITQSGKTLQLR